MNDKICLACGPEVILVPLDKILPMRLMDDGVYKSAKYKCIEASIKELGLIDLTDRFALVEVPEEAADYVVEVMQNTRIRGRKVMVRMDRPPRG